MVSQNQSDVQLPSGWKVQIKVKTGRKFKCYVHSKTGKKLYSRLDVLRYMKNGSVANRTNSSTATKERANKSSKEQKMQVVVTDDSVEDLPAGWSVELKMRQSGPRKGTTYKCFIDPLSGSKFYSKSEVLRHLQIIQHRAGPSGRDERRSSRHSSSNRPVEQQKALESSMEAKELQKSKATTSERLSSGGKKFGILKAQESNVEENANELQDSKATASTRITRFSSGKKKRPVEQLKAQDSNIEGKLLQNSKPTASTRVTRLSSGENKKAVEQLKAQEAIVEANLLQNSKLTASTRVTRLSSGENKKLVEQLKAQDSIVEAISKSTASTRVTRLSSGENKKSVEQLKAQESIVATNLLWNSNSTPSTRVTRLSSGKNKSPVEHLKAQEANLGANLLQNSDSTASTRVTRLSSRKNKRPVEELKAQEYNVKAKLLQSSTPTASTGFSSGKKKKPIQQLKAQESNGEANELRHSKSTSKKLSPDKTKVIVEHYVDEDLPPGWIKEMRKRVSGSKVRTDPFYFYPASGLVFRSKREVLRYLETGEISRHAYWRRNNVDKEAVAIDKTFPTPSVKRDATLNPKTRKDLFAAEESPKASQLSVPEARVAKEVAVRRITRSSSRVGPTSITEEKPNQNSLFNKTVNVNPEILSFPGVVSPESHENDGKLNQCSPVAIELPSTSTRNQLVAEKTVAVTMKGCSNIKAQTTKRKINDQDSVPSHPSKRLTGMDAQPVFHSRPIAAGKKAIGSKSVPSLVDIPNDLQDEPNPPADDTPNGHSLPAKHSILDVSTLTVLSTEDEHLNNSDSSTQKALPVFSKNEVIDVPSINTEVTELSLKDPRDDPSQEGQKVENSIPGCLVSQEKPGSTGTAMATEPSGTVFSFPPPLWSDPCLEFAYKTLTGAIPLDDNLAIEDYIQHQLRTSKPHDDFQNIPEIDMPTFDLNEAITQVPPSPESIRLPNGNGLLPQKTDQVKS